MPAELGLGPWLAGYLVVEILALLVPAGRRLRRSGLEGRRKLNLFALQAGFAMLLIQAVEKSLGAALFLADFGTPTPFSPRLTGLVAHGLPLVAFSFGAFLLARWLSERGIGNGFALLLSVEILVDYVGLTTWTGLPIDSEQLIMYLIWSGLVVVALGAFLRRGRALSIEEPALSIFEVEAEHAVETRLPMPPFPASIVPATLGLWVIYPRFLLFSFGSAPWQGVLLRHTSYDRLGLLALAIGGLSCFLFYLFSSARRLNEALSPQLILPRPLREHAAASALRGAALLAVGVVGFSLLPELDPVFTFWPDFISLLLLTAVAVDLIDELRFRRRQGGPAESVLRLDNVYLAGLLAERLRGHGIDALARGYCYRSLFFLFRPLVKIDLLVPEADAERALAIVEPERIRRL